MLYVPSGGYSIAKIIGIDPGSKTMGIACLSFDVVTEQIISIQAYTLDADRLTNNQWLGELHGDRFNRIAGLENSLLLLFRQLDPLCIAVESPFFNHFRPQAYGVLMEVMAGIRNAVFSFDPWKELYYIDPSSVKRAVGAPGNANKELVKEKILTLPEIYLNIDITYLDEHSLDAIAVAYARYKRLFLGE